MNLKELSSFKTILEVGSFSKAALKLHYAQSTITMQIQRLEKELGFLLFERGSEIKLTPSGETFSEEIDSLIDHWNYTIDFSKKLRKEEVGTINIGVNEFAARTAFPKIIADFREVKPNIFCGLIIDGAKELYGLLEQQAVDFLVTSKPTEMDDFVFEKLYRDEVRLVASKKFIDSFHGITQVPDLRRYPIFTGGEKCIYFAKIKNTFSSLSEQPVFYTVNQMSMIVNFLDQFPSVGVVTKSLPLPDNLMELNIEIADPYVDIGVITRKKDNKYLSQTKMTLLDIVRKAFQ